MQSTVVEKTLPQNIIKKVLPEMIGRSMVAVAILMLGGGGGVGLLILGGEGGSGGSDGKRGPKTTGSSFTSIGGGVVDISIASSHLVTSGSGYRH